MIKSIEKAIRILNFVSESGGKPVSLGTISKTLGFPVPTCSHITETLTLCHFLERVSRNEGFIIGPGAYAITTPYMYRMELLRIAVPYMRKLCNHIKENVVIGTYNNGHLYVPYSIYYRKGHITRKTTVKGKLFSSATGLVILSFLDHRERDETIKNSGEAYRKEWEQLNTRLNLQETFSRIQETGVHIAYNVNTEISALACPIFHKKKIVAAIGVNMPSDRFFGIHLDDVIAKTKQSAMDISRVINATNNTKKAVKE